MGEFERHRLVLGLARRGAGALTLLVMALAGMCTFGLGALLVNRHAWRFVPEQGLWGFSPAQVVLAGALAAVAIVILWKVLREPDRVDGALGIRTDAQPGDPGPDGEPLRPEDASALNNALEVLRGEARRWRATGRVKTRCRLYWSPVLQQNAIVYGSRASRVRVVFSADLLLDSRPVLEGPGCRGLSHAERRGILAHELGHAEGGDLGLAAAVGGVMRVLTFSYMPFLVLDRLVALVARGLSLVPGVGWILSLMLTAFFRGTLLAVLLLYRACEAADRFLGHVREYAADALAVKILGSADEMLSALAALDRFQLENERLAAARGEGLWAEIRSEGRKLLRPARWERYATLVRMGREDEPESALVAVSAFFQDLGNTHPPVRARLTRLAKLGFALELDRRGHPR